MSAPYAHSGSVIADRYRLERRIALGGMGEVWFATDLALGRDVALKLLLASHAQDEVTRLRFRAEAKAAASVSHPGIVPVFDFGEEEDEHGGHIAYLVMEYVPGDSLAKVLEKSGPLAPERTLEIVVQTATALDAAHRTGLVHRDVKPGNLLVDENGNVRVTDFGIARSTDATPLTRTGTIVGTPQYISPEQAKGQSATPASDLYSLGVVAYACLAGRTPFSDAGNEISTAMAHIQADPPPLPDHVSPNIAGFVLALLAKDPLDRPASASSVATAAKRLLADPASTVEMAPPRADEVAAMAARPAQLSAQTSAQADGPPATHDDPAPANRPSWARRYAAFAVVLVLAVFGLGAVFLQGSASDEVQVPNVVGKDIAEARSVLDRAGLTVEVRERDRPGGQAQAVESQDPEASTEVESGSEVVLIVDSGKVRVPGELTGTTYADASEKLAQVGLKADKATRTTADHAPGTVIDVSPTGRVADGATIVLAVASAPATVRESPKPPAKSKGAGKGNKNGKNAGKGKNNGNGKGNNKGKGKKG